MLEWNDALDRILGTVPQLTTESVNVSQCLGRVLSQDVVSPVNLPVADNSSMDGYALQAAEVQTASESQPVRLEVIGSVPAGSAPSVALRPGTCVRLFTGSFLPTGADAVVMQEDTIRIDAGASIDCLDPVKPWENVRFRGEDVKLGAHLMSSGQRIQLRDLGMLAACGFAELSVACRPKVGILATGQELQEAGEPLRPGAIYESNRMVLAELVRRVGGEPTVYPLVEDTLEDTKTALARAAAENDAVVTSGGVSVGDYDLIRPGIEALGGELHFWRVRLRPGKPFVFASLDGIPLFGLPGNPVSAVTTFMVLVRPALLKMQGAEERTPPIRRTTMGEHLSNPGDRPHYFRVQFDSDGAATSSGLQGSHALQSLARSDGWLRVEPGESLTPGTPVEVMLWDEPL